MTTPKLVPVRYIGTKPTAKDNVLLRPRLVWNGHGDVKWVPEDDARLYVRYEDVWELAMDLLDVKVNQITGLPIQEPDPVSPASGDPAASPSSLPGSADGADDPEAGESVEDEQAALTGLRAMSETERAQRLGKIIRSWGRVSKKYQMPDGKLKTDGLSKLLGFTVYAEERDAAFEAIQRTLRETQAEAGQLATTE